MCNLLVCNGAKNINWKTPIIKNCELKENNDCYSFEIDSPISGVVCVFYEAQKFSNEKSSYWYSILINDREVLGGNSEPLANSYFISQVTRDEKIVVRLDKSITYMNVGFIFYPYK